MIVMTIRKSYLEHYLEFFRDQSHRFEELFPLHDMREHVELGSKFTTPLPPNSEPSAAMDRYTHPCWCNPELIYVDELRGNEVWLHKRVQ